MKIQTSYTKQHWEFGFGLYMSAPYKCNFTGEIKKAPNEIAFMFGPYSLVITFGKTFEIIEAIDENT